jgi:alginate O-acetyltransferase complex protein AlgI
MAYFILHGTLMMIEARLAKANRPIDRVPWVGRIWTLTWLLDPLPVLFHRPFLAGVVWPLIGLEA